MIFSKNKPFPSPHPLPSGERNSSFSPLPERERDRVRVTNQTKNTILAEKAVIADSLFSRLQGLLGRDGLASGEGLILKPCNSIHTFFMRFPIDVAFVDRHNRIIKIYSPIRSWRLSGIFLNSHFCIELPAGALETTQTQKGDQLSIIQTT